jgi:hypothetical protein
MTHSVEITKEAAWLLIGNDTITWDGYIQNELSETSFYLARGLRIAIVHNHSSNVTQYHIQDNDAGANARLIAAAPELLEALQMLMPQEPREADSYDLAMWGAARTAIAKANGDTATVWNTAAAAHREDRDNLEKRIACEQAMTAHHAAIAKATTHTHTK